MRLPSKRAFIKPLSLIVAVVVLAGSCGLGGFLLGKSGRFGTVLPTGASTKDQKIDFSLFWQAWGILDHNFYGTLDNQKRLDGAIGGMVAGLQDPYTVYMQPAASRQFRSELQGSFGGIGAELTVKDNYLTVISALQGTPADKAGVKGQDIITEINGKKTEGLGFQDAIDMIRGEKGSTVELTLVRKNVDKPFKVSMVRDIITVKSVSSSAIGKDNSIAYVKLNLFGDDTVAMTRAALQDAKTSGKKGLVLDLRNNPGGLLDAAREIIGMLVPDQITSDQANLHDRIAVLERHKDGKEDRLTATSPAILADIPIVVLVNGGSASASEILSGALKDYKRATLVGTKTFGKGSVQTLLPLDNGGTIKVTIAKWFTPLGVGIDGKGIEPDITLDLPDKTELSTSDPQVTKALEILNK
jgi:carboxyl-terminal processing protease